jgi:hypothetical protein
MKFQFWTYVSALGIVAGELLLWFIIKPEFRGTVEQEMLMWSWLPVPPLLTFVSMFPLPERFFRND